jgi:hypothetical protein
MMGKMLALGLVWAAVVGAQSLRVTEVCEVEDGSIPAVKAMIESVCSGETLYQGEKILFQSARRSVLTRSTPEGKIETVTMDHIRKEWRAVSWDETARIEKETPRKPSGEIASGVQSEVRLLDGERIIAGQVAKGFEIAIRYDSGIKVIDAVSEPVDRLRTSIEIWIARDLRKPRSPQYRGESGMDAGLGLVGEYIRSMLGDSGQGEASERLKEIPKDSLTLEYTMRLPPGMGGMAIVTKKRVTKISAEAIPEKVFAIPEGYRRVE